MSITNNKYQPLHAKSVETVRALAKAGARIVVGARDLNKANQVVDKIKNETGNQKIEVEKLDLSSLKSVNEFVQNYLAKNRPLNVLVTLFVIS